MSGSDHTSRMASLLGRLRREMNGAVVEAMERAGVKGPLNYGVSIPTIRAIAAETGRDHAFARFLYRQEVRELRMAAVSIAEPSAVTPDELPEWLEGDPTLELLDELALKLFSKCSPEVTDTLAGRWLTRGTLPMRYAALMTLARVPRKEPGSLLAGLRRTLEEFPREMTLARAAVPCCCSLAGLCSGDELRAALPDTPSGRFVREELAGLLP